MNLGVERMASLAQTQDPYVSGINRIETGVDPLTRQLLFGLDGQGGFIPGAFRAAERTFFDEQGRPRVVPQEIAGLSEDQLRAMEMARQQAGIQQPYLSDAESAYRASIGELGTGLEGAKGFGQQALSAVQEGIGGLGRSLGESEQLLRQTTGAYDPSMAQQFYNPYEDRVVQQTIEDVMEAGDMQDMAQRARDIQTGGESAFGSRARLGASERREALGRGLGQALSGIRSQGFSQAQQMGVGEFARQQAARRAASSGLAGLGGARFTGAQTLGGALTGMGNLEAQIGQQRAQAQMGLGGNLQNLGAQAQQAGAFGANQLLGTGGMQQQLAQQQLEAQRANALQAQQAPLAQYQSLLPFVQTVPSGQQQTSTTYAPQPSALQAGLGVGLSTLGALGNFFNQGNNQRQQTPYTI